jgi:hypothetical protein
LVGEPTDYAGDSHQDAMQPFCHQESIAMTKLKARIASFQKRLRRFASIILFVIYITIATAHFCRVDDPRVMGGLHIAAGVAHLL